MERGAQKEEPLFVNRKIVNLKGVVMGLVLKIAAVSRFSKRQRNGAWQPDAIWMQGTEEDPSPRCTIFLSDASETVETSKRNTDSEKPDSPVEVDLKLDESLTERIELFYEV